METKKIILIIAIFSFISVGYLFVEEQINKASFANRSKTSISISEKRLCGNDKYSTTLYPSGVTGYESKIQLNKESLSLLESRINENDGKIPEGDLDGLDCLEELDIMNTNLNDLTEISKLSNLEIAVLQSNNISDLSPLSNLKKIKVLNLTLNYGVSDLKPLSGLTTLEKVFLSYANVSDASPLASLTNLNELSLSWTKVSDISTLKPLTNLKTLYVRHTGISYADFSVLGDNTNLVIINH
jgi:internalin A